MGRDISQATIDASKEDVVIPVVMAYLDFSSSPVYVNSSPYSLMHDGNEYLGVGVFGGVSAVKEGTKTQAYGIDLTLSGIPSEFVSISMNEHYQGRDVKVFLGLLDHEHQLINSPVNIFSGRMDVMNLEMGETATITVTAESRLADWERVRARRYTHEDQVFRFPDDKGLEFIAVNSDKEIIWGRA